MRIRFQNNLALVASILFHIAVLLIVSAPPEIGKNTPVLDYPIRARVIAIRLAQTSVVQTTPQSIPNSMPFAPMTPPASVNEGRLERSEKIYMESSDRYFTPAELDNRPTVINPPDLGVINISPTAEGKAILLFFLNESGAVDKIDVEQSTLPEVMLEQLQSQRDQLHFTPGNKNGINVKSVIHYEIELAKEATVTTIDNSSEISR